MNYHLCRSLFALARYKHTHFPKTNFFVSQGPRAKNASSGELISDSGRFEHSLVDFLIFLFPDQNLSFKCVLAGGGYTQNANFRSLVIPSFETHLLSYPFPSFSISYIILFGPASCCEPVLRQMVTGFGFLLSVIRNMSSLRFISCIAICYLLHKLRW